MKKIIQLVLLSFLILIAVVFYNVYLSTPKQIESAVIKDQDQLNTINENSVVKNLRYDVKFDDNKQYIITADLSEIGYQNNIEIVNMQRVIAIFIDETNVPLTVTSNKAIYNNTNYNTNFTDNVRVDYENNVILSDNMDINFDDNTITIYENVNYEGLQGIINADNVKIDLITKKIQIYMSNKEKKVEVITK
tara:strand:+ start:1931 stop:2506 length:576 start_codon:yes stop_codon:yes gene_type:complete